MLVTGQVANERSATMEDVMRVTANIAAVRGYGFTGYAGAPTANLAGAARFAKNVALFAAAPFIGLAYAAAFPFVGLAVLAWYAVRAVRGRAGAA
jgi:hypothetical protein